MIKRLWQKFYRGWMKFAHFLGLINSWIILSVLFIALIGIYNLFNRLAAVFRGPRPEASTYWQDKKYLPPTAEILERQF